MNANEQLHLPVDEQIALSLVNFVHGKDLFRVIEESRPSLRKWLPWVDFVQDMGDLLQLISYYRHKLTTNGALTTCILYQEQIAGIIGLNFINWQHKSATIGYWLGEPFRGKGLMLRSCRRLVDHAFYEMKLHKVHILCATGNFASQRIPEKLKFRREGTLRDGEWLNDRYVDLYSYGMLSRNWQLIPAYQSPSLSCEE